MTHIQIVDDDKIFLVIKLFELLFKLIKDRYLNYQMNQSILGFRKDCPHT